MSEEVKKEEQSKSPLPTDDPMELAAMNFTLYLPRFLALCQTMSKGSLSRVLEALICNPLKDHRPLVTQQEKEAVAIGKALNDAKFMMMIETLKQKLENVPTQQTEGEKKDE